MARIDRTEQQIINVLEPFPDYANKRNLTDKQWTKQIKSKLGELGIENGFRVCASGFPKRFESEWLYDLVWYKYNKNDQLIEIPLVVESEWKPQFDEIKYDFEKLLLANSKHRLLIFQASSINMEDYFLRFKNFIKIYKCGHVGDRFLFAGYNWEEGKFHFKLIVKE